MMPVEETLASALQAVSVYFFINSSSQCVDLVFYHTGPIIIASSLHIEPLVFFDHFELLCLFFLLQHKGCQLLIWSEVHDFILHCKSFSAAISFEVLICKLMNFQLDCSASLRRCHTTEWDDPIPPNCRLRYSGLPLMSHAGLQAVGSGVSKHSWTESIPELMPSLYSVV